MPKRICTIAYTHYRTDARPRREAEALVGRGDTVDFLALSPDGDRHEESLRGVNVIDLPVPRYRGLAHGSYLSSYGLFFLRAAAEAARRHLRARYDVVHVHTMPDFMVFTALLPKLTGARVVLDLHDTMPELYQSKFGVSERHPAIRLLRLQERLSCAFADRLICVHEPHRELLASRGVSGDKLTPILNVPDVSLFGDDMLAPPDSTAAPRVVYHGTIAKRLGLDLALEAFARIRKSHPRAHFDIFGSGDFASELSRLIGELALGDAVSFPNRQFKVDDLPRMLAGASAGVIANRSDPATRWMLPVKLMEYAHLGIPAVVPRLPVIEHYFDASSVAYYEPDDVSGMATALERVLGDAALRGELRANAGRVVRRIGWGQAKRDLFAVIDG